MRMKHGLPIRCTKMILRRLLPLKWHPTPYLLLHSPLTWNVLPEKSRIQESLDVFPITTLTRKDQYYLPTTAKILPIRQPTPFNS